LKWNKRNIISSKIESEDLKLYRCNTFIMLHNSLIIYVNGLNHGTEESARDCAKQIWGGSCWLNCVHYDQNESFPRVRGCAYKDTTMIIGTYKQFRGAQIVGSSVTRLFIGACGPLWRMDVLLDLPCNTRLMVRISFANLSQDKFSYIYIYRKPFYM